MGPEKAGHESHEELDLSSRKVASSLNCSIALTDGDSCPHFQDKGSEIRTLGMPCKGTDDLLFYSHQSRSLGLGLELAGGLCQCREFRKPLPHGFCGEVTAKGTSGQSFSGVGGPCGLGWNSGPHACQVWHWENIQVKDSFGLHLPPSVFGA